jgi:hypothetical protein
MTMAKRRIPSPKYAVGYRRPPKANQFRPGETGNPRGRPKGSRNIRTVLFDVIGKKIAVTENGQTRRLPALEVMLRRLVNDAVRNDPRAIKLIVSMLDRYEDRDTSSIAPDMDELQAEDREILAQYLPKSDGKLPKSEEEP